MRIYWITRVEVCRLDFEFNNGVLYGLIFYDFVEMRFSKLITCDLICILDIANSLGNIATQYFTDMCKRMSVDTRSSIVCMMSGYVYNIDIQRVFIIGAVHLIFFNGGSSITMDMISKVRRLMHALSKLLF